MARADRNSIFLEDATVIAQTAFADEQYILRVHAPKCAAHAAAGSFVHLSCDPMLPMRRPLSIMRVSAVHGWVEFLYKTVGQGLALLSKRVPGDIVSVLGPIGKPFISRREKPRPLLIGGGVGIPPMVFLADQLRTEAHWKPVLFMGSEVPFPFALTTSALTLPGVAASVDQNLELMESWHIPGRLASLQDYRGCHKGFVTDLARQWLRSLSANALDDVEMFACGPTPMLRACAALAQEFGLPAQVSLEEHMACAVGGCAGCTVAVQTEHGPAMKRVCVDGPVFDAATVFPVSTDPVATR